MGDEGLGIEEACECVCVGIGQVWSGQRKRCGQWVVVGLGNSAQ